MGLDDFHFDERDKNFFEAVKEALDMKLKPIKEDLTQIKGYLQKKFKDFNLVVQSESLKKVTEHGEEFIKNMM